MLKFKELVLSDSRAEFTAIVEEDKAVAWTSLPASLDTTDSDTRTMSSAIAMGRSLWLQVLDFHRRSNRQFRTCPLTAWGCCWSRQTPSSTA